MGKKTKRLVQVVLAFILLGFVALNVLAYNHARAMMTFTTAGQRTPRPEALGLLEKIKVLFVGVNLPRPVSDRKPVELDPRCRVLSIHSSAEIKLSAWYVDQGARTPLVILFHGYGAEKTCLLPEARAFIGMDTSVMLVDFRGSGGSSESYTTIGFAEADDVAAVTHYVRENFAHSSVILFGKSMGAVAMLRAIDQHGIAPDGVIVEAVFDTMLNTVRHRFRSMDLPSFPGAELLVFWGGIQGGFNGFGHNPVAYARAVPCPILFMHGSDDARARVADARRVFAAVPGEKELKEFPAVGHEGYLAAYPEQWREIVARFIDRL